MCLEHAITDVQLRKNTTTALTLKVSKCSKKQNKQTGRLASHWTKPWGGVLWPVPISFPGNKFFMQRWSYYRSFEEFCRWIKVKSRFIKSTFSKKLSLQVCSDNICSVQYLNPRTHSIHFNAIHPKELRLQCGANLKYLREIWTQARQCGWSIAEGGGKWSPYL